MKRIVRIGLALAVGVAGAVTGIEAQTGTVRGRVVDAETRAPLADVQISIEGTSLGGLSGGDGTFVVERVPVGERTVAARLIGYRALVREIDAPPGGVVQLEIALSQGAVQLGGITVIGREAYVADRAVTAARLDLSLLETPQSVTVITADQLEAQAPQTLEAVLRYTAGVRAEKWGPDNRGDWFALRGGSEGSTLLDGMRLPLSGWWGNVRNEPYAFERVEVLRGPASVAFGQNGPGGLINLVSKLPRATSHREVEVALGNREQWQAAVDVTGPVGGDDRLLYRLVALASAGGTQVEHADEERQYVAPSVTWRPDAATSLTAYGQYQRDESNNNVGFFPWEGMLLPASEGRIPVETFIGEPEWDTYGGERVRVGYQAERSLSGGWTLRHDLRHDEVDGHLNGMYANFWEGLLDDDRRVNRTWYVTRTDTRITTADVLLDGTIDLGPTSHKLLIGADGLWTWEINPSAEGAATPLDVYDPVYGTFDLPELDLEDATPTRTRQLGIMIQDQIAFGDRWRVLAGLRRDETRTEVEGDPSAGADDGSWSSRLGLTFLAGRGWAPYASYSESFEAVTGVDAHDEPFEPMRGRQFEAGVKWSPAAQPFTVTAAAYELKEKNRLTTDPDDPTNQIQQGVVRVRGAELTGTASLAAWDLLANYTYTDAEQIESSDPEDPHLGEQLLSTPRHSAAAWAVRKLAVSDAVRVSVGGGVRYVGETWDGTGSLNVPSNTLVDALVAIEHDAWRLAINASNVLDETYIATCIDRGDCWYGSRRKLMGSLTYRW